MKKNRKAKEVSDERPHKTIRKYGYEYLLVAVDRSLVNIPTPCFMGESGFALMGSRKLQRVI